MVGTKVTKPSSGAERARQPRTLFLEFPTFFRAIFPAGVTGRQLPSVSAVIPQQNWWLAQVGGWRERRRQPFPESASPIPMSWFTGQRWAKILGAAREELPNLVRKSVASGGEDRHLNNQIIPWS
jgi:hypothetical protein